ncbi:MAG: hypothetical protein KKB31_01500 [Nanoarchaeota archaeon]|nr:hypothetical protein [Nanoarchaeota archaeon]
MIKRGRGFLWFLWTIVTLIGIMHLTRAIFNMKLTVSTESIPIWASYIIFAILGFLSYKLFIFLRK